MREADDARGLRVEFRETGARVEDVARRALEIPVPPTTTSRDAKRPVPAVSKIPVSRVVNVPWRVVIVSSPLYESVVAASTRGMPAAGTSPSAVSDVVPRSKWSPTNTPAVQRPTGLMQPSGAMAPWMPASSSSLWHREWAVADGTAKLVEPSRMALIAVIKTVFFILVFSEGNGGR